MDNDALAKLTAKLAAAEDTVRRITDSRNHFDSSAKSQKRRVTLLRHRQKALLSGLNLALQSGSFDEARVIIRSTIDGWNDEELIYRSRIRSALE